MRRSGDVVVCRCVRSVPRILRPRVTVVVIDHNMRFISNLCDRLVVMHHGEELAAGTPREREKAPGDDNGFLWRLNAYWRYEQMGSGVMVEVESLTLSRNVPFLLAPIAKPIISRIARETLERTLSSVRGRFAG